MRALTSMRRFAVPVLVAAVLALAGAGPAAAYAPVDIVHTETVPAGPYTLVVGFSTWPIRAMRSLDFTFTPTDGIAGKSGTMHFTGPDIDSEDAPLVRHPRKRDSWGLDVLALDSPGTYSIGFAIDGPRGQGTGTLRNLSVLDQPGPPLPLSWAVGSIPFGVLLAFIGIAWHRTRPGRQRLIPN